MQWTPNRSGARLSTNGVLRLGGLGSVPLSIAGLPHLHFRLPELWGPLPASHPKLLTGSRRTWLSPTGSDGVLRHNGLTVPHLADARAHLCLS